MAAARAVQDGDEIILVTEGGKSIRMQVSEEQFRVMGRSTAGVKAINLPAGDRLVSMAWARPEEEEGATPAEAAESAPEGADAPAPEAGGTEGVGTEGIGTEGNGEESEDA